MTYMTKFDYMTERHIYMTEILPKEVAAKHSSTLDDTIDSYKPDIKDSYMSKNKEPDYMI